MNEKIGVNKEIDSLGRLVIPKEMRDLFGLERQVELVVTEAGVLVRNPQYTLVKKEK
jgi:AbrB family looped-hinge helix DNA binding protein